jgi:hypothetical protein
VGINPKAESYDPPLWRERAADELQRGWVTTRQPEVSTESDGLPKHHNTMLSF